MQGANDRSKRAEHFLFWSHCKVDADVGLGTRGNGLQTSGGDVHERAFLADEALAG